VYWGSSSHGPPSVERQANHKSTSSRKQFVMNP
jgi:hypothetical protein